MDSHRMELLATCDLFRFGVGGVTIEHYVRGIKQHLCEPG